MLFFPRFSWAFGNAKCIAIHGTNNSDIPSVIMGHAKSQEANDKLFEGLSTQFYGYYTCKRQVVHKVYLWHFYVHDDGNDRTQALNFQGLAVLLFPPTLTRYSFLVLGIPVFPSPTVSLICLVVSVTLAVPKTTM